MKKDILLAAALCLLSVSTAGCSPGSSASKSAAVEISQPADSAFAAFEENEEMTSEVGQISNSSNIDITKNDGKSITYSIASALDKGGSTITFYFDDLGNGKSKIRTEVDVPPVSRGTKYLSEKKIRDRLETAIKSFASAVSNDQSAASALRDVNMLLLSVDIATNSTNDEDDLALLNELMGDEDGTETALAANDAPESRISEGSINGEPSMALNGSSDEWNDNDTESEEASGDDW